MSQGKIIPLIAEAELRAEAHTEAEIRELITAIDNQIDELEKQLDEKLAQIIKRIEKLEAGGVPEVSA
jgi:predicted  nucleic acid-binding Zn-ribbon protein